ncbi:MAG: ATP-dependent zinc metalloprotease FtsH [Candidatus Moranbacteria bacterium]|nr:ATP-dependent zinc metalloprotease FtsH [Candidatus Moranbacteria bacterium]
MDKLLRHLSTIILVFFVIVGLVILYQSPEKKPAEVSLSELVSQINNGEIKQVSVKQNELSIEKRDGTTEKATKEGEASFTETLRNYEVNKDKLSEVSIIVEKESGASYWAAAILPILIPFVLIAAFIWFMMRQAQRGNAQALSFGSSRARMLDPKDKRKRITFKDIAGAKESKEELSEIVDFLKEPKKFLDMGAKIPRGVLLLGPPGTGKTLMAKAVAGEAGVPFFNISGSEFVEMFVGVGASRVRDLFKQAKKNAPAIVFIDEIDAVGRHRGAGLGGGHDEREQTLNQILVEMDGFETDSSVIVIASTNRPDVLDPALLRPGRFDRRVTMDLPDINEREAILRIHSKGKPLATDINLRRVAERTPGFSGADLANLTNEAAILATRRDKKIIDLAELTESIEKVILGPERRSRIVNDNEKKVIAYHEAGHALIASSLPNADPVQKVSIISRGHAGGYTLAVPTEDKMLHSTAYFYDELATLLGGYASEKLIFNDTTTGPSNDLERATNMARGMVTRYGMSRLGARTFGHKQELVFLGKEMHEERNYSEKTAQEIDAEVSRLVDDAFQKATTILTEKKVILDRIANTLLERETLEKDLYDALLRGETLPPMKPLDTEKTETKQA